VLIAGFPITLDKNMQHLAALFPQTVFMASVNITLISFIHDTLGDPSNTKTRWIFGLLFHAFITSLAASVAFGGIAVSDPGEEGRITVMLFPFFFGSTMASFVGFMAGLLLFAWYNGYAQVFQLVLFGISLCFSLLACVLRWPRLIRS
jgi:hypothetical protein